MLPGTVGIAFDDWKHEWGKEDFIWLWDQLDIEQKGCLCWAIIQGKFKVSPFGSVELYIGSSAMYALEYIRIKELQFLEVDDRKRHFWRRHCQFDLYKPTERADIAAFDNAGLLININMAYPELYEIYIDWERNFADYFAEIKHSLQDRAKSREYKLFCTYSYRQFGTFAAKTLFFVQNLYAKCNFLQHSARLFKEITLRKDSDENVKLVQELFDGTLLPVRLEEFGNLAIGRYSRSREDLLLLECQRDLDLAQQLHDEMSQE